MLTVVGASVILLARAAGDLVQTLVVEVGATLLLLGGVLLMEETLGGHREEKAAVLPNPG